MEVYPTSWHDNARRGYFYLRLRDWTSWSWSRPKRTIAQRDWMGSMIFELALHASAKRVVLLWCSIVRRSASANFCQQNSKSHGHHRNAQTFTAFSCPKTDPSAIGHLFQFSTERTCCAASVIPSASSRIIILKRPGGRVIFWVAKVLIF